MPVSPVTMSDINMGDGFIDRDQVQLLVWFEGEEAAIAGPAVDHLNWTVRALRALASQWCQQEVQDVPPMPPVGDEDALDCTEKDLAVVIFRDHTVIAQRGEIFPNSGLASYPLEVAGRRRHDTEWVTRVLEGLADSIEQREGFDHVL